MDRTRNCHVSGKTSLVAKLSQLWTDLASRLCSIERTWSLCVADRKGKRMHIPSTEAKLRPPSLLLLALEGTRAMWEFGASLAALPILQSAPRGDGHAVLIFPGLVASDVSTHPLGRY